MDSYDWVGRVECLHVLGLQDARYLYWIVLHLVDIKLLVTKKRKCYLQ